MSAEFQEIDFASDGAAVEKPQERPEKALENSTRREPERKAKHKYDKKPSKNYDKELKQKDEKKGGTLTDFKPPSFSL